MRRDIESDSDSVLGLSFSSDNECTLAEIGNETPVASMTRRPWGQDFDEYYGGSESDSAESEDVNVNSLSSLIDGIDLWETSVALPVAETKANPSDKTITSATPICGLESLSELGPLLEELAKYSSELDSKLLPLRDCMSGTLKHTSPRLAAFLEMKVQLLLSYVVNLSFYSMLKLKGCQVFGQPVVEHLNVLKVLLEKIRPIEAKVKPQIDRLLGDEISNPCVGLKPSLSDLVEIEGDHVNHIAVAAPRHQSANNKVLLSALELEGLSSFTAELSDKPLVSSLDQCTKASNIVHIQESLKSREAFEEENFIRLPLPKKEKKLLNKTHIQKAFALAGVDDVDDLAELGAQIIADRASKLQLNDSINMAKQVAAISKGIPADEYVDYSKGKTQFRNKNSVPTSASPEPALIADMKIHRKHASEARRTERLEREISTRLPEIYQENHSSRVAGFDIDKNKGLLRKRKKEDRNARVKNRNKYEKAVKRRKGQVLDLRFADSHGGTGYSGEKTGVKTGVQKSTKLR